MARPPRSHVALSILPVGLAEAAACSLTVTAGKTPTIAPRVRGARGWVAQLWGSWWDSLCHRCEVEA